MYNDDANSYDATYYLILDICAVLYSYGYTSAPAGHLMRLVGVSEEFSQRHDNLVIVFNEDTCKEIITRKFSTYLLDNNGPGPGDTIH